MGNIAYNFNFDAIVFIDLSGDEIEVGNFLFAVGISYFWWILGHVVTDSDHEIGFVDSAEYEIFRL